MRTCFPEKIPMSLTGEPSYENINTLNLDLYENAGAVPTTLGGGAHGHVRLIMNDALYQAVATATYTPPINPTRTAPRMETTAAERETAKRNMKQI
eukprot:3528916-Ditylum_brightwellii.AAC.1